MASATAWTNAQTAAGVVSGILTDIRRVLRIWASTTAGSTGLSDDDSEVKIVPLNRIQYLRSGGRVTPGSTERPLECAITPLGTTTQADIGKRRLDYWPMGSGYYFPIEYFKQFTPIATADVDSTSKSLDLSDLGSRLLPLLAARRKAPLIGRPDLVPAIERTMHERCTGDHARKYWPLLAAHR